LEQSQTIDNCKELIKAQDKKIEDLISDIEKRNDISRADQEKIRDLQKSLKDLSDAKNVTENNYSNLKFDHEKLLRR
jgi:uncharacterized coiled-coil DUF342 family protein